MTWKLSPHFREAEQRRQRILDFLHTNPGAYMRDLGEYLNAVDDYPQIANMIHTMSDWREICYRGNGRQRQYFALATTTRTEAECLARRDASLARANEIRRRLKNALHEAQSNPARYVHRPGERPLRNQGGQGACRQTVYASGAQNY